MNATRPGVVTGLALEARCLKRLPRLVRPPLRCAGADPERARAAAWALLADERCDALVSLGVCGALDPLLRPGHLVVADSVVEPEGGQFPADAAWVGRLVALIARRVPLRVCPLAGVDTPLLAPEAKAALALSTGAAAADMESHAVAAVAAAAGVPFLALRAVCDAAGGTVPEWLPQRLDERGAPRLGALLLGLAARPGDGPALVALATGSRRAIATLGRAVALAGPRLGL